MVEYVPQMTHPEAEAVLVRLEQLDEEDWDTETEKQCAQALADRFTTEQLQSLYSKLRDSAGDDMSSLFNVVHSMIREEAVA